MIRVVFKDMHKSDLIRNAVVERVSGMVEKFPDLMRSAVTVTVSMENSPLQPGPDQFTVTLRAAGGRFKNLMITKSAETLYLAIAELTDALLERLNRYVDKSRVLRRRALRAIHQPG